MFGCVCSLCVPHGTKIKAHLVLARWKRSYRQLLASQAEASTHGGPLARGEMRGIRGDMRAYLLLPPLTFSLTVFFLTPFDLHNGALIRGKLYIKKMHLDAMVPFSRSVRSFVGRKF